MRKLIRPHWFWYDPERIPEDWAIGELRPIKNVTAKNIRIMITSRYFSDPDEMTRIWQHQTK